MKVIIKNWGPIAECEYDLDKSLIVTYGDNNIGKSYAMQVVYLLLKYIIEFSKLQLKTYRSYLDVVVNESNVKDLLMDFAKKEDVSTDITNSIIDIISMKISQDVCPLLENAFENTFGNYQAILNGHPEIKLVIKDDSECDFYLAQKEISLRMPVKKILLRKVKTDFHKSRDNKSSYDIYLYENRIGTPIQLIMDRIECLLKEWSSSILSQIGNVYFLPASRSGIYTGMNSFGPILAQLSQNRAYIRGTIQIPSISEPISDYYMQLSTIKNDSIKKFSEIAKEIEKNILKGEVTFDNKKKEILYHGNGVEENLEMRDVSSMVSEISPITAYLKYVVTNFVAGPIKYRNQKEWKPEAVIFIEEPEAHLHPQNQVKLMKIFVKLIKQGIKLVMASHSNYVFNELNNMVIAEELNQELYLPILMKSDQGKSNTIYMQMDEFGASDENFADVAEAIYEERESLILEYIEKKQRTDNDKSDKE